MATYKITVEDFLEKANKHPVIDVRSPAEYSHAHIPKAFSLPLFSDAERKIVGTAYKQQSKQHAIKIGLKYFGVKMVSMVEEVEKIYQQTDYKPNEKIVLVHCWRGGMRSAGVAWLLDLYGFTVYTLIGGYKAYRNWVFKQFKNSYNIKILGGYTGSAKTTILQILKQKGASAVDLEKIALHRGSAFGKLGMPEQPTQEMFENKLAEALVKNNRQSEAIIWIEDESQRIGTVNIPADFFKQMRSAEIFFLDIPFKERLNYLVKEYGIYKADDLINAVLRIKQRLGGLETKNSIQYLIDNKIEEAFSILLSYYDKWYLKGLYNREQAEQLIKKMEFDKIDVEIIASQLLQVINSQSNE